MKEFQEIINAIKQFDKIIILRHILPDGDAYGFQFGLRNIIKLNWPDKTVKISGKPNSRLNFIGHDFDTITDQDFSDSLVIIGDTANKARIDETNRWQLAKKIIKIDHHPSDDSYGDINLVRPDYCACSELLAHFIQSENLKIDAPTAKIIYHGIVTDSDRFLVRFPQPRTFELAAFLLKQGFDLAALYQEMYAVEKEDLGFRSYVYNNFKTTDKGVAYLFLTQENLAKLKVTSDHAAYDYVALLGNLKDCPIWAFFCEGQNGEIRGELRSHNLVINEIARKYGGGGHRTSSGVRLKDFISATRVINDLNDLIGEVHG
ncbi:phosphoesterase RecJ-like protein [Entomoplasma freundtii]|uniref:Bifunctional oligoribonuclease and PAP phosphatase NrnA n=1 Tax=Entomoplasma freundtii TaxID=74700 RepID=A0A2K8NQI0_9MOLU|nr:bifunctional oligoribonuclease/PAP phosphatase NrnA [Entomoplasma freundtii]ATZ16037.1 bifunctional oligoribonuclease and PAP phosphatase NrnA [Entomoplasma freundtii]TDY58094.1 phosphoesterase RecJ-like protein [Entomoplasma freundtii]